MYSNSTREQELGEYNIIIESSEPDVKFDRTELQLKEVREVVHGARAGTSPGLSGISYKFQNLCCVCGRSCESS